MSMDNISLNSIKKEIDSASSGLSRVDLILSEDDFDSSETAGMNASPQKKSTKQGAKEMIGKIPILGRIMLYIWHFFTVNRRVTEIQNDFNNRFAEQDRRIRELERALEEIKRDNGREL